MTIQKIPETSSKRRTQFTRAYKTNGMIRKNSLDQPDRKTFMQKTKPSTIWKETKAIDSDEELNKIEVLMNDLETKDDLQTEMTPIPGSQATKMKTQIKAAQQQRMGLVMNKIHDPPMVTPLREKAPITMDTPSMEELQAPWEVPRLETTRGVINRVGLKRRDSSETPIWRAIESKETSKAINKFLVVTNGNKKKDENKTQLSKTKVEAKNVVRTKTKLRQKNNYDLDRINELKMKLREGLKVSSLPPGDLLDLWPARGPIVHALRLKNRLCQRSVLLNEGPKYDSKGGTYMPRFKPRLFGTKKMIDFPQTRSPLVVLPRCCNCCRKSVLGCE
ncbi:uncharacterized protein [Choristoneura fumiferana]|uniref:uncharacterized protein n=1 Tax=Choristoneura fumiferana TaxID=7141 RepID=UPI003D1592D1